MHETKLRKIMYFCDMKQKLLGMTLPQLQELVLQEGLPKFTAGQIAQWLYVKKVDSLDRMTNLSKAAREKLAQNYEVGWVHPQEHITSADGTRKYLFPVSCPVGGEMRDSAIEAVMIPDGDRATLCVSSQAGCKMGCKFCMTGRQGFHGNLDAAQILSQIVSIEESDQLTNIVFMGMGEPLDNYGTLSTVLECLTASWGFAWSPKRITVSSIGVLPNLKRLLDEHKCHIAISLHNPFPEERLQFMPVQAAYNILDVVDLLKQYDFTGQRRVSFEYTMFTGYNDSKRHADALSRLLKGLECRVNLIRFHKIPDFPYETSNAAAIEMFRQRLGSNGITATLRASRGEDILAACGMLAGKNRNQK